LGVGILRQLIEPSVDVFRTIDWCPLVCSPVRGMCIIDELAPSLLAEYLALQRVDHESMRRTSCFLCQASDSGLEIF
jgi:hypothetical protein